MWTEAYSVLKNIELGSRLTYWIEISSIAKHSRETESTNAIKCNKDNFQ